MAKCVGFPGGPAKSPRFSGHQPAGAAVKGRESGEPRQTTWGSAKNPHTWGGRAQLRTSRISGQMCRIFRESRKSPRLAGPPTDRFFGEGARFRGPRPAVWGAEKYPHTWGGRVQFRTSRISCAMCRIPRAIQPAGDSEYWRDSADPQPDRLGSDRKPTYMGRPGAISHIGDQWPNVYHLKGMLKNRRDSRPR